MTTTTVTLSPEQTAQVKSYIAEGRYASADEAVKRLLAWAIEEDQAAPYSSEVIFHLQKRMAEAAGVNLYQRRTSRHLRRLETKRLDGGVCSFTTALADLAEIRGYPGAAPEDVRNREIEKLEATFLRASEFRFIGRIEPELKRRLGHTRSLLSYLCRVLYYPESFSLEIFAIIHGRRDPLAALRGR